MQFIQGLNTDVSKRAQPPGTYRHAENVIVDEDLAMLKRESMPEVRVNISGEVRASVKIDENLFVVAAYSEQGDEYFLTVIDTELDEQTRILDSSSFTDDTFELGEEVDFEHQVLNNGDIVVYFTDNTSFPKRINVTELLENHVDVFATQDDISLIPSISENPRFFLDDVTSGGSLKTGSYQLAFAYEKEDSTITNFFYFTNPIRISNSNLSKNDFEPGGEKDTVTNRRIDFRLTDIDTNYDNLIIASIYDNEVNILPRVPIVDSTIEYTFTGSEASTIGSLDEIIVNNANYDRAKTLAQLGGVLYIGNVRRPEDINYQKYANNIVLETVLTTVDAATVNNDDRHRKSFGRGEVYSFYISLVKKDGSQTPAFHIPGRAPLSEAERTDPPSEMSNVVDRQFQLETSLENGLQYWENLDETYPNTDDWDSTDIGGEDLRGKNVRHHRMPHEHQEAITTNGAVRLLGIRARNIEIPNEIKDKIIGYKIHYAKKRNIDKWSLGQSTPLFGFTNTDFAPLSTSEGDVTSNIISNMSGDLLAGFFGDIDDTIIPFGLSRDKTVGDDMTVFGKLLPHDIGDTSFLHLHPFELLRTRDSIANVNGIYMSNALSSARYREVIGKTYVDANIPFIDKNSMGLSRNISNILGESKITLELSNNYSSEEMDGKEDFLASILQFRRNYHRTFDQQELVSASDQIIDKDFNAISPSMFGGDVFINRYGFKAHTAYPYLDFPPLSDNDDSSYPISNVFYQPDEATFIGSSLFLGAGFVDHVRAGTIRGVNQAFLSETGEALGRFLCIPLPISHHRERVVQSRDLAERRNIGDNPYNTFWPFTTEESDVNAFSDMPFQLRWIDHPEISSRAQLQGGNIVDDNLWFEFGELRGSWFYEFYIEADNWRDYNEQYSKLDDTKPSFPYLRQNLQSERLPTRVIRSAKDTPGIVNTNFRVFREADFMDLPLNKGELTKLTVHNDTLVPHMERTMYRTRGREELQVDDQRAFIGSGNIFETEPKELVEIQEGYAGISNVNHGISTPHGYAFIDTNSGKVFVLTDRLNDISQQGMKDYFRDNIDRSDQMSIGYDPYNERLFVTNVTKEWTLNYSFITEAWISFHQKIPSYYFNTQNRTFYSRDNEIFEIKESREYGTDINNMPFIIEFVHASREPRDEVLISLLIDTIVKDESSTYHRDTFDRLRVTNSYQDTGEITLLPLINEDGTKNLNDYNIRRTKGTWNINRLRNQSDNKRLYDRYHIIRLEYFSNPRTIELNSALLNTRHMVR